MKREEGTGINRKPFTKIVDLAIAEHEMEMNQMRNDDNFFMRLICLCGKYELSEGQKALFRNGFTLGYLKCGEEWLKDIRRSLK